MRHIRIGKDISLRWSILTDGAAVPLQGRDLTLELKSPIGKVISIPYSIDGNVLTMTYYGYEQTVVGEYSLTLWENKGKPGQNVVDAIRTFKLVRTSPEEADFIGGDLQVESVDLGSANLEFLPGGWAALEDKVDDNTNSISNINAELDTIKEEQDGHDHSIAQINTTLEEHSERIAQLESGTPGGGGDSPDIAQINATLDEIKAEQTEQNSTLADHEERLVYTESDLVKVREEYNSIISELVKSIGHTQNAFVVETNDSEGYIYIDDVKKTIPANSIKAFRFNKTFRSGTSKNQGIASFRFLVTDTSEITKMGFMFAACSSLISLDLSNFDTSAVTGMAHMFLTCSSLTSLDLSNFDTSEVTDMWRMFDGCTSLTSIILGPNFFKTSAVTNIVFSSCAKWTNESVVTSLVTNSYDRAAAGLNTFTLLLHANTKAALSDEQKATITNKGYTIA